MKESHLEFPQSKPIYLITIFKQFSEPSLYNIDIDFTNDSSNDIDLSVARVKSVLDNLETNKAQGPDAKNHGCKKCELGEPSSVHIGNFSCTLLFTY